MSCRLYEEMWPCHDILPAIYLIVSPHARLLALTRLHSFFYDDESPFVFVTRVTEREGNKLSSIMITSSIKSQFCGPSNDAFAKGHKFVSIRPKWWNIFIKLMGLSTVMKDSYGNSIPLSSICIISLEISMSILILQLVAVPHFYPEIFLPIILRRIVSRLASWKLMMDLQNHNSAICHRHFLYSASTFFFSSTFESLHYTARKSTKVWDLSWTYLLNK